MDQLTHSVLRIRLNVRLLRGIACKSFYRYNTRRDRMRVNLGEPIGRSHAVRHGLDSHQNKTATCWLRYELNNILLFKKKRHARLGN